MANPFENPYRSAPSEQEKQEMEARRHVHRIRRIVEVLKRPDGMNTLMEDWPYGDALQMLDGIGKTQGTDSHMFGKWLGDAGMTADVYARVMQLLSPEERQEFTQRWILPPH